MPQDQKDLFGAKSAVKQRDFHGFAQYQEEPSEPWRFQVTGFADTECTVLRTDGSREWVPIDQHDRILIAGRKFGPRHWRH